MPIINMITNTCLYISGQYYDGLPPWYMALV